MVKWKKVYLVDPTKEEREHWEKMEYTIHSRIQNPSFVVNSKECPTCKEQIIDHYFRTVDGRTYLCRYGLEIKPCLRLILPDRGDIE